MRFTTPLLLAALLPGWTAAAPMKDRITSDELLERRQAAETKLNVREKQADEARVVRADNQGIISQSTILSAGGKWTLVPQGAILFLPESHTGKINRRPVGNLVSWREFLRLNRAWISAEEITLNQAKGVQPFDERRVDFWSKDQKVIVATYLGGPISHKTPELEPAQGQKTS